MFIYSFEKLEVWKDAKQLSVEIYLITKAFPRDEKFGLVSQIRRAAVSISSNIAEGSSRKTKNDQAHFYVIAYSSSIEMLNQLILCFDLNYINEVEYKSLRIQIEKITNKLNSLRNFLLDG